MNLKKREVHSHVSSINHPSIIRKRRNIEKHLIELSNMKTNGVLYKRKVNLIHKNLSELKLLNKKTPRMHKAILLSRDMKLTNTIIVNKRLPNSFRFNQKAL